MATYTASPSRTQGRAGWSVIFRHPALTDPRTGKPGKRVRYGLGTRDEAEAEELVGHVNELLDDERWWSPTARDAAEARFHPRVVEIFYSNLEPERTGGRELRDELLPLPSRDDGYRHALLLGTTGAGKTTLLRHLIGTDPIEERFPTTATGRTTIADTEVVTADGPFRAAVTFFKLDEVREHLEDCVLQAVLAAHRGEGPGDVRRALLQHPEQRFRFNYVLGDGPSSDREDASEVDDELLAGLPFGDDDAAETQPMEELGAVDMDGTNERLGSVLDRIHDVAQSQAQEVVSELEPGTDEDLRVIQDLIEETLDERLREDEIIQDIVDELLDEIRIRFDLVDVGDLTFSRQSWPEVWEWQTDDREAFIRQLRRFTSNAKYGFGRLLTPLVDGVRVVGPFTPAWVEDDEAPKLVFFDTEGLGHTPDSSSSIPTRFTELIDKVDAVLLVDNAEQPMQAAPAAAMRALAQTGHAGKLFVCFTHFDAVTGDNLPTDRDKALHVLKACDGTVAHIGEQIGPFAERPLRARLKAARYFLGNLHERLDPEGDVSTLTQLRQLVSDLEASGQRPTLAETRPVYEQHNLVVAIRDAVEDFHDAWRAILGLQSRKDVEKEHWARIKALSRRFAELGQDEYLHLRPVADLQSLLQKQMFVLIQNPIEWKGGEPSDDEKQALFETLANELSRRLLDLAQHRLSDEQYRSWQEAWRQRGAGSTRVRARIMADDIYAQAAPVPRAAPSSGGNEFLHEVIEIVRQTADEYEVELR